MSNPHISSQRTKPTPSDFILPSDVAVEMPLHYQTDDRDCVTERPAASLFWMSRVQLPSSVKLWTPIPDTQWLTYSKYSPLRHIFILILFFPDVQGLINLVVKVATNFTYRLHIAGSW